MPVSDDLSGLPTSLPADRIEGWNRVIRGILSHSAATGPALNAVLADTPDFALGQAVRGLSCLLLARSEMVDVAREAHACARSAAPCTPRESAFVLALGTWLEGHPTRAAARLQAVLDETPRDALAMKMVQSIHFVMGRPEAMRASVESLAGHVADSGARVAEAMPSFDAEQYFHDYLTTLMLITTQALSEEHRRSAAEQMIATGDPTEIARAKGMTLSAVEYLELLERCLLYTSDAADELT